ncbi:MAG: PQQ-binding-like beta-propeller repeat protein, partial [Planctomycetota bacterium]
MQIHRNSALICGILVPLTLVGLGLCRAGENESADLAWSQWRGSSQNGVAPAGNYPMRWSGSSQILWKSELPGNGGSTPVIAGGMAFFTAGVEKTNQLIAVRLVDGQTEWSTKVGADAGGKHRKGSGSNPSAVTDGNLVFAYFRSGDLACVDLTGKTLWSINLQKRFGADTLWWDLGTSPTLIGDLVVVAVMQSGPSYLVAFEKATGKVAWKTDRILGAPEEAAQSYATPIAIPEKNWIAVMGADHLTVHSASDGRELGRVG